MRKNEPSNMGRGFWIGLLLLLSLGFIAGGLLFYRYEANRIERAKYLEIKTIAGFKADQIHQWRTERLTDVLVGAQSASVVGAVRGWSHTPGTEGRKKGLRQRLEIERTYGNYSDMLLVSGGGHVLFSLEEDPVSLGLADRQAVKEAKERRGAVLSELWRTRTGRVYLDAVAPVVDARGKVVASLIYRVDANIFLYPMVRSWPSPSASAEVNLVRKEGGDVLFLNEVRFRVGSALSLRYPLTSLEVPAVQAVLGKQGAFLGRDYRNVDVLADLRPIPQSSWYMVTKVDAKEVFAEATSRAGFIFLAVVLFLLLGAFITAYVFRHRQAHLYRTLYRYERAERESQEFFRTTLYSIGDAVVTTDATGRVKQMNQVAELYTGWREQEAQGRPIQDVLRMVDEKSRVDMENPAPSALREHAAGGRASHAVLVARDLTERRIAHSGAPIKDENGTIIGAVMVFHDQTEERTAAEALRESEAKFRSYIEQSPLAVFVSNSEGLIVDVNPAALELLGYERATLVRMHIWDIHPLENREDVLKDFEIFSRVGRIEVESRLQRRDGSRLWVSLRAAAIGDGLSLAYCADITKHKQAEEVLKRYELLSAHSRDMMLFVQRGTGKIIEANAAAEKAYGYTREELLTLTVHDLRAPESLPLTREEMVEAGSQGLVFEKVHRRKDGTTFPVEVSARGATINGKRLMVNIARDITGRRRNQETIELLKHSIDVHYDGAYWLDSDDRIFYVNDAGCEALGYGRDELIGMTIQKVNPALTPETMKRGWARLRRSGSTAGPWVHHRKDGSRFPVEVVTTYVEFGGREFACSFARDVTEKKKLEDQLRQAQKMEAIGTLAGGVAHDFNNILTVIMGLANLVQMSIDADDRVRAHVDQIVVASERAAELTQSLLAFSRKQRIMVAPHRVGSIIESTGKLLKRLLPEDVELKIEIADEDAVAMLDVSQIDQVLMNLATNARDAMPKGGSIFIGTKIARIDEAFRKAHGFGEEGRYVCITVADNGAGMDEKTLPRIFDPFFTTKEVGKGTGLGLASVYGIVKQHEGYITVTSEILKGTTFDIYLPLVDGAATDVAQRSTQILGGSEMILVIEDDPEVRRLVTTFLRKQGYATLDAANGDEALKIYRERVGEIGLVILDVVMPGKNGREVLDEICRVDPRVKAIFMSGYTGDVILDKGVREEGVDFLQKPLSVPKLLTKVRQVLDR